MLCEKAAPRKQSSSGRLDFAASKPILNDCGGKTLPLLRRDDHEPGQAVTGAAISVILGCGRGGVLPPYFLLALTMSGSDTNLVVRNPESTLLPPGFSMHFQGTERIQKLLRCSPPRHSDNVSINESRTQDRWCEPGFVWEGIMGEFWRSRS